MKQHKDFWNRVALSAELPGETLPGVPLVEIASDRRVLVENHKGVVAYGCNEIKIKVSFGILCVAGSSLQLACMTKHQLVITGRIDRLSYIHRRK